MKARNQWVRIRLALVFMSFVGFLSFVGFRLVQLQILSNSSLEDLAKKQFQRTSRKLSHRLPIYDRNGEELAVSMPSSSVFARPKLVRNRKYVAKMLTRILGGTSSKWTLRLNSEKPFVWIQRQVAEDVAKRLVHENLTGVFVEPENRRLYPNGELAANLLGFTDLDGNGLEGLELTLNTELTEPETKFKIQRDGKGNPSYIDQSGLLKRVDRKGIHITLDRRLQHALEEELDQSLQETKANSVMAVVMEPFSGEILALGQRPTFDPNRASKFPSHLFANRLISHLYEPGSTMKVLLAAGALEAGIMRHHTLIDCENGQIRIGKKIIKEAEHDHRYGTISLERVIRYSSNVGAVKIAQALGADRVRATLDRFGLTTKTGIRLPGEVFSAPKGDRVWKPIFLATVGFGQGISVTPLQLVSAFAPFANGGYLVRPKIFFRESPTPGSALEIKRVLSPQTVRIMKDILVSVTEEKGGTGLLARVPGVRVAGKTGTAQKYEAGVGYDSRKYFSSFVGFLPADKPELLVGVMVDEPKRPYYASQVAAPLFRKIAERSLQILDRGPKSEIAEAEDVDSDGLSSNSQGSSSPVESHELVENGDGKWIMPDLKGLSMKEALQGVGKYVDNVKWVGYGYLDSQIPEPGATVTPNSSIVLHFSPAS